MRKTFKKGERKMKIKQQDAIVAYLLDVGYSELSTRSKKYRVFSRLENDSRVFVGKNGSFRWG